MKTGRSQDSKGIAFDACAQPQSGWFFMAGSMDVQTICSSPAVFVRSPFLPDHIQPDRSLHYARGNPQGAVLSDTPWLSVFLFVHHQQHFLCSTILPAEKVTVAKRFEYISCPAVDFTSQGLYCDRHTSGTTASLECGVKPRSEADFGKCRNFQHRSSERHTFK